MCRGQIDAVRFGIERHCPCATLRFQCLHDVQFPRGFFSRNRRDTFATRRKSQPRHIVKRASVNSGTDRDSCNNLAALGLEHRHYFVVTRGKQAMMRRIERDPSGLFTWRQWPARHHFVFARRR